MTGKAPKQGSSRTAARRTRAVESFQSAAHCIGPVEAGMSLFAITRGQFSMLDAILHVLDCVGPADVSVWTWVIAEYEVERMNALRDDGRIRSGRLVIDGAARKKNGNVIDGWRRAFGPESVRFVVNHSKIATVEGGGLRVLLRGSMNLNHNPRFEQLDVTEGGPDFDLVRELELSLPVITDDAPYEELWRASKVSNAFEAEELALFRGLKAWRK